MSPMLKSHRLTIEQSILGHSQTQSTLGLRHTLAFSSWKFAVFSVQSLLKHACDLESHIVNISEQLLTQAVEVHIESSRHHDSFTNKRSTKLKVYISLLMGPLRLMQSVV